MDLITKKKIRDKKREEELKKKEKEEEVFKKRPVAYIPSRKTLTVISFFVFIAAITYLYLSSDVVLKQNCEIIHGITCENVQITGNRISFEANNMLKEDINLTLSLEGCEGTIHQYIKPNKRAEYSFECLTAEKNVKKDIQITYVGYSGLPHNKTGIIVGRVK